MVLLKKHDRLRIKTMQTKKTWSIKYDQNLMNL